ADGGPDPEVRVRHQRDRPGQDGQAAGHQRLIERVRLDVRRPVPKPIGDLFHPPSLPISVRRGPEPPLASRRVIVLHTLGRRWFVVAFLVGYFAASVPERGWKASIRFAVIAYGVALAAELSSTRNGFPFSHYTYTGDTRGDELYLSNIPAAVIGLDLLFGHREPIRPAPRGLALAAAVVAFDVVLAFAIGAVGFGFAALAVAGIMALTVWLSRRRTPETAT